MADIFVSYASQDRAKIEPLVGQLESAGYSVWWDKELKGGSRFSDRIEQEIKEASVVVVVWSPHATRSRWVADEADLALETGNLLPISLDGSRAPMGFRQHQTVDFSGWSGGEAPCVAALLDALRDHSQTKVRTPNQPVALPKSHEIKSDASIAVLPFVNMSPDPDQEFFADGISEELLNLLAKIKELGVIARTSSFSFKGTDKPIEEIAALLKVAYILEGSVRKAGNRVRITAQLIETRNSHHLWSETYDRTLDDIFAIQDEISAAIVAELKDLILGGEHIHAPHAQRSSDINAYEHYLLGQQLLSKRTRDDITRGKEHFETALKVDPEYTPAFVGLADAHLLLSNAPGCYGTIPLKQALADAEPLLIKALNMDDTSAEAHGILSLHAWLSGNADEALVHANRALTLNPNYARGYAILSFAYFGDGDPAAPILSTMKKAVELDPASLVLLSNLANEFLNRLDFGRAEAMCEQMAAIGPGTNILAASRTQFNVRKGEYKAALEILLAPEMAFSGRNTTNNTLYYASLLGYSEQIEPIQPVTALEGYMASNQLEEARRLGPKLAAAEGAEEDYDTATALAGWHAREERYGAALDLLTPFDEPDPDKWGRHFNIGYGCVGAMLSLYCRGKLGKKASARLYLDKLKDLHQTLDRDPDGRHYLTDFIGAVIATTDGKTEAALTALEHQVEWTMREAKVILSMPNFASLKDKPRYQTLLAKVEAHFASERAAAEAAGLLPIPEELLARLKEG